MYIHDKKWVCVPLLLTVPHITKEKERRGDGRGRSVWEYSWTPQCSYCSFHMHLVYFYYLQIPLSCTPCSLLEWALPQIDPSPSHLSSIKSAQTKQTFFSAFVPTSIFLSRVIWTGPPMFASNNFWSPFQCFILNQKLKINKVPYLDLYHIPNFFFQCHILNPDISFLALPCHWARNQHREITKTTTPFPHFCLGGRKKKASCAMCRMFILLAVCVELFINPQSMICFSFMVLSAQKKYWRCFFLPLKRVIWIITALPMGLNHL